MEKIELKKISETEWEIAKQGDMKVPARIFASEKLMRDMQEDKTLEQVKNVASLPGIIRASLAMPDAHQGYGFSIGGVAAFDLEKGVISPGGVGYDINCSVRLLKTNLRKEDVEKKKKEIIQKLFRDVPSGVGEKGRIKLTKDELNEVMTNGAKWAVEKGYGIKEDYENTEEAGCMQGANPEFVSQKAKSRGIPQLGSLGAGNHFLELQYVDKVFDKEVAKVFGLEEGQVTIMIHCGSRGLGHQVASDYIQEMEKVYGFKNLPDRELVNAPIQSELGKKYFSAMACAANFAFANKQLITHWVRDTMKKIFPDFEGKVVYDVCHNIAKFEKHTINGKEKEVLIMRKGATRSFGPGREELPKKYLKTGQPVILPGSMGTASYVLVGTKESEEKSFSSTAHGAGRVESRTSARKGLTAKDITKQLNDKGIEIISGSDKGIVEEAPQVYKDIDEVALVSDNAKLGKLVARVIPLAVMKG